MLQCQRIKTRNLTLLGIVVMILISLGSGARDTQAQDIDSTWNKRGYAPNSSDYWTPERLKKARPMPMPTYQRPDEAPQADDQKVDERSSEEGEGQKPSAPINPDDTKILFIPEDKKSEEKPAHKDRSSFVPLDAGTANAHFTSSRLIPFEADQAYPYLTVGKLFFVTPEGDFVCSGSVIQQRLILTAGHCVHSGVEGTSFYTDFLFVPAFREGTAPFSAWDWDSVVASSIWTRGGGSLPNAADYAIIVVRDIDEIRIGEVTGWLGWQTNSLLPNHVHILGYPQSFDSGLIMHQVTAQTIDRIEPNSVLIGSDMTGGSSGGPWIQNFGELADGQLGGQNPGRNRVVGVVSFGPVDETTMLQGSSILNETFVSLFQSACDDELDNCSQ